MNNINRLQQIIGFKIPLDGEMTALAGKPVIDILKLDNRLMQDYNYQGSMNQFIHKKFGDEALNLINEFTLMS